MNANLFKFQSFCFRFRRESFYFLEMKIYYFFSEQHSSVMKHLHKYIPKSISEIVCHHNSLSCVFSVLCLECQTGDVINKTLPRFLHAYQRSHYMNVPKNQLFSTVILFYGCQCVLAAQKRGRIHFQTSQGVCVCHVGSEDTSYYIMNMKNVQ